MSLRFGSLLTLSVVSLGVGLIPLGCGQTRDPNGFTDDDASEPTDDQGESGDDGGPVDSPDLAKPGTSHDLAGVDLAGVDMAVFVNPNGCAMPLTIQPADEVIYVDGVHQFSVTYKVLCGAFDVGPMSTLTVDDNTLGGFAGVVFTTAVAGNGVSTIRAAYGPSKGQTSITVKPTTVVVGPGTPMNAPNLFGGANNPNVAPQWVYPADGVLVPPNLSELEFQFLPGGNQLFELGFAGAGLNLKIYTVCNVVANGCTFELDAPTWLLLSTVGRNSTVNVTLRGTGMNGGAVGTSSSIKVRFANEDITGGLYYWAASAGSINRYDFGLRGQKGELFIAGNLISCAGCHALSRDGSRIGVGFGIPGSSMQVIDVATKKTLWTQSNFIGGSTFEAFTPDGSKIMTNESNTLTVRDPTTGLAAGNTLTNATMPDVSADGSHVVYAKSSQPVPISSPGVGSAGISVASFANNMFGAAISVVNPANGQDNYYPAFSPDGAFVVFNRSFDKPDPMNNNAITSSSYDQTDAAVMFVSSTGGGAVIDSKSINANPGNSWPKWAPFVHHFNGSTIFWLTFSSRRPYGLRGGTNAQIWMVGVDEGQLKNNADGAYPAFRLPFQDFATGNHIPQWATKVARQPCSIAVGNACPPTEACVNGRCQPL